MATVVSVVSFRVRNDDGTEASATWKAPTNVSGVVVPTGVVFRVRFELQETGGTSLASAANFWALQCKKNSGAFQDVNATSTIVRSTASAFVADSTVTTDQLLIGTGTFGAGEVDSGNGHAGQASILTALGQTEDEYSVQVMAADVTFSDVITFQIIQVSGSSPAVTPTNSVSLSLIVGGVAHTSPYVQLLPQ